MIQVTNAAPHFEDNLFLDELLEMNVQMGNAILMAKYQNRDSNTNVWNSNAPAEENSQDNAIIGNKDPVSQSDGDDDDSVAVDKNNPGNTEEPHTKKEPQNTEDETADTTTTTESVNEADNAQQTDAPYWGDETSNNKNGNGWFGDFFS